MSTSLLPGPTTVIAAQPSRLLDQVAQAARQRGAAMVLPLGLLAQAATHQQAFRL